MNRNELVMLANSMGFDPTTIANDSKLENHLKYLMANQSTMAGTKASGTLTQGGAATADDQVKIGDVTYTYVTALSEAKATSTFTIDTNAAEGSTVTVEGQTYTFRAVPVSPYDVDIGGSAAVSLDNLKSAINDSGTAGTTYGTGTVAHPLVTAEANAATTQEVTAKNFGTYGNKFLTSTTVAGAAWDATTLEGGVDAVPNEIALTGVAETELNSLKQAINNGDTEGAGEGEGTVYSTGTRPHPQVIATTNGASTQVVEARDFAVGEDISTTDPVDAGTDFSWGATTLASGVSDQNAVDATALAGTGKGVNANV